MEWDQDDSGKGATSLHQIEQKLLSDLKQWAVFLTGWNWIRMMTSLCCLLHSVLITSSVSGGWGCRAFRSANQLFQAQWQMYWPSVHITVKDLVLIVVALPFGTTSGEEQRCLATAKMKQWSPL